MTQFFSCIWRWQSAHH